MTYILLRPVPVVGVICEHLPGLGALFLTLVRLCSAKQDSSSPSNSLSPFLLQIQSKPTVKVIQLRWGLSFIQHPEPPGKLSSLLVRVEGSRSLKH